jgi:putative zinc finger/helix-turn-helix YgiT family protein
MMPDTTLSKPRKQRDRPFPWPCGNCLKEEVYPATMPYVIDVKHDGHLYHLEVPELKIPKCRACGELVFSNSVDDQILQALRARVGLLTPEQIRTGRETLSLKSEELAEKLGVTAETISLWESGRAIPSRAMDNFLRVFFAVPEARAVLRGAERNPNLGTMVVPHVADLKCGPIQ